MTAYVTN